MYKIIKIFYITKNRRTKKTSVVFCVNVKTIKEYKNKEKKVEKNFHL